VQNPLFSSFLSKSLKIKIYRTIILPVVLCGFKTRYLTLQEECRLRVYENRVLRRIFWSKRDEVTGEWRTLHNEELYDLYSPNTFQVIKPRRMRWVGHMALKGDWRDTGVDGKIILKQLFKKCDWGEGYGLDCCVLG